MIRDRARDKGERSVAAGAATRGILFGRYERCDANGLGVMRDISLSRVHLLLLDVAGTLHAIDTVSTNGTTIDGQSVRCEALRADATLRLGNVSLRWDAAS